MQMRDEEARDSGRSDDGGDEKHLAAGARGDEEHAPSALADEGTQLRDGLLLVLPKVRRRGVLGEGARGEHRERGGGAAAGHCLAPNAITFTIRQTIIVAL